MKKTFLFLAALLCILLTAHGVSAEEIFLEVEQTRTTAYGDTIVFTAYFHDKVIRHESGIYEVQGRQFEDGRESRVRWLFAPDGTPLGCRVYDSASGMYDTLNYFYCLDLTVESYTAYLDNVDRIEDNVIYYSDGSIETLYLQDGLICKTVSQSADGYITELVLTPSGMLKEFTSYPSAESPADISISVAYTHLNPAFLIASGQ